MRAGTLKLQVAPLFSSKMDSVAFPRVSLCSPWFILNEGYDPFCPYIDVHYNP